MDWELLAQSVALQVAFASFQIRKTHNSLVCAILNMVEQHYEGAAADRMVLPFHRSTVTSRRLHAGASSTLRWQRLLKANSLQSWRLQPRLAMRAKRGVCPELRLTFLPQGTSAAPRGSSQCSSAPRGEQTASSASRAGMRACPWLLKAQRPAATRI